MSVWGNAEVRIKNAEERTAPHRDASARRHIVDFSSAFEHIQRCVAADITIADAMGELISCCDRHRPHPDWARFRSLPLEDCSEIRAWLLRSFVEDAPPETLRGLWFGLFNPIRNGEVVTVMHVCGADDVDAHSADCEWAVNPTWHIAKPAESSVLAAIYGLAHRSGGLGIDAEYALCLGYSVLAVKCAFQGDEIRKSLPARQPTSIVVGFDDGDFIVVGSATRTGFSANN